MVYSVDKGKRLNVKWVILFSKISLEQPCFQSMDNKCYSVQKSIEVKPYSVVMVYVYSEPKLCSSR